MADEEFATLRQDLESYGRTVVEHVERNPDEVFIDRDSVNALLQTSPLLSRVDHAISERSGDEFVEEWPEYGDFSTREADRISGYLQAAGFRTIGHVEEELKRNEKLLVPFAARALSSEEAPGAFLTPGIGLFYLAILRLLQNADTTALGNYLQAIGNIEDWADELREILYEVTESEG